MHIKEIGGVRVPPLDHFTFNCDERVNLFVGPNASGKTTVLRAIDSTHSREKKHSSDSDYIDFINSLGEKASFYLEASDDWPRDTSRPFPYNQSAVIWDSAPLLYVPATRINLPSQDIFDPAAYPPEQVDDDAPLKEMFDTKGNIFDGDYVESSIKWLHEGPANLGSPKDAFLRALEVGYSCAKSICPEVIRGSSPQTYVGLEDGREAYGPRKVPRYGMGIAISDDYLDLPLYAGVLSAGTQGTLLWVWALALKIANHYRWQEGWEEKPAILLIDEIENHLHPTWQRRVIPALLDHFPGLQIFATTHSPFVVAGLNAGQVHLLKRDENGRVTASINTEDIIGWTADEILRNLMGVDDPTDDRTAAAARELRQLRKEGPGNTPEAEEHRQGRIRELRDLVDRDLLAGGPWKAQREIFEQHFAETLEKLQQQRQLNQENG